MKNIRNTFSLHKGEDPPKQCLDLLSHSQLRKKSSESSREFMGFKVSVSRSDCSFTDFGDCVLCSRLGYPNSSTVKVLLWLT